MQDKKLIFVFLTVFAVLIVLVARPYSGFAGSHVHVGFGISGQVVVTPAPPPVVVQPAPSVIVTPAPPPVVVVEKPPPKRAPRIVVKTPPRRPPFRRQVGLGLRLDAALHGNEDYHSNGMGGAGLLLRLRMLPHFATELSIDCYSGEGYSGEMRTEVPFTIGFMWMPMYYLTRVQFYTIGGFGGSAGWVGEEPHEDRPYYLGGFAGLGFELKLGVKRRFALFTDLRGFIRKRVNDRPDDPDVPTGGSCRWNDESGSRECTDWEGGVTIHLGFITYF